MTDLFHPTRLVRARVLSVDYDEYRVQVETINSPRKIRTPQKGQPIVGRKFWAHVLVPYAYRDSTLVDTYGMAMLPNVDSEVVIGYLQDSDNLAVVIGSFLHSEDLKNDTKSFKGQANLQGVIKFKHPSGTEVKIESDSTITIIQEKENVVTGAQIEIDNVGKITITAGTGKSVNVVGTAINLGAVVGTAFLAQGTHTHPFAHTHISAAPGVATGPAMPAVTSATASLTTITKAK